MKQNEKLQSLVDQITKFSKRNRVQSKESNNNFRIGYYKGWADCYELAAQWIQEIIDTEQR